MKKRNGPDIIEGYLISREGVRYPIRNGVPRFAKESFQDEKSVSSFGFEWNTLNFDLFYQSWKHDIAERNFGKESYFKGKTVVECGAGSGMHTRWMLDAGVGKIIALELSDTVDDVMQRNLKGFESRCAIIQADISAPPIKPRSIKGLVYCINVIQHTKDPLNTTAKQLYNLVAKGGTFAFNIYMTRGVWWRRLDPHRWLRTITTHLPQRLLLTLCYAIGVLGIIPVIDKLAQKALIVQGTTAPGKNYWKRKYMAAVLNSYDYYGAHSYQYIYTGQELKRFFDTWKLPKKNITHLDAYMDGAQPPGLAILIKR